MTGNNTFKTSGFGDPCSSSRGCFALSNSALAEKTIAKHETNDFVLFFQDCF